MGPHLELPAGIEPATCTLETCPCPSFPWQWKVPCHGWRYALAYATYGKNVMSNVYKNRTLSGPHLELPAGIEPATCTLETCPCPLFPWQRKVPCHGWRYALAYATYGKNVMSNVYKNRTLLGPHLELPAGIEPATCTLRMCCSTN